jgi:hypothetical protein
MFLTATILDPFIRFQALRCTQDTRVYTLRKKCQLKQESKWQRITYPRNPSAIQHASMWWIKARNHKGTQNGGVRTVPV